MDEEGNVANVAVVPNVMVDSLSLPCSTSSHGPGQHVGVMLHSHALFTCTNCTAATVSVITHTFFYRFASTNVPYESCAGVNHYSCVNLAGI